MEYFDHKCPSGLILKNLPKKQYDCIYIDPPWLYDDTNSNGKRGAAHKYDVMTMEDIASMPILDMLKPNGVVFCWFTAPLLNVQFDIVQDHWGLEFKTRGFLWVKTNINDNRAFKGTGHYTRGNPEDCMIFRPKKSKWMPKFVPDEYVRARRGEHSEKPAKVRQRIEAMMGEGVDKLEMFCRTSPEGWDVWGNEVGKLSKKQKKATATVD